MRVLIQLNAVINSFVVRLFPDGRSSTYTKGFMNAHVLIIRTDLSSKACKYIIVSVQMFLWFYSSESNLYHSQGKCFSQR